jgi:hypothetical protein
VEASIARRPSIDPTLRCHCVSKLWLTALLQGGRQPDWDADPPATDCIALVRRGTEVFTTTSNGRRDGIEQPTRTNQNATALVLLWSTVSLGATCSIN